MKIKTEIELTPEELKEIYTPGPAQQEFFTRMSEEFKKNMLSDPFNMSKYFMWPGVKNGDL